MVVHLKTNKQTKQTQFNFPLCINAAFITIKKN